MTIIRNVQSRDRGKHLGAIRNRDALLSAVPTGKILALETAWTGGLRPEFDTYLDDYQKLSTPLVPPRILSAEPATKLLDLGLAMSGRMGRSLEQSATNYSADASSGRPVVDLTGFRSALDRFDEALREVSARDSWSTVHRAVDSAIKDLRYSMNSVSRGTKVGDTAPSAAAELNRRNAAYWADGKANQKAWDAEPPVGASGPVRRRFTGDGSKPISQAEINRRNREFWGQPKAG